MPNSNSACPHDAFAILDAEIIACRKCPRLIEHMREVARVKRRAWMDWEYWGKPVPSFGPGGARLLILGLAPGAHGANRTGRVFTGDSSGDLLYRVLYSTGFASQPASRSRDDGLTLQDARITCAAHCAPPDNKPLPAEIRNCRAWLTRELELMTNLRVVVALGRVAFEDYLAVLRAAGRITRRADFPFAHAAQHRTGDASPLLIASYHPSQQNTSTGKLNEAMLREVFVQARAELTAERERCALPDNGRRTS